ncbi:MAG: PIN domain-containing protein [Candidatus Micrarchaeaceae archaeon]|jgi:predicted nucleic acid-binding protein
MELVIDANILIAAFIKKSTTRELLLYRTPNPIKLCAPPFILEELSQHALLLSTKTGIPEKEIMRLVLELLYAANIELISDKDLTEVKSIAEKIAPDKKDSPYFAVALYKNCEIWSNDKPLKKQNRVIVITTKELLAILNDI